MGGRAGPAAIYPLELVTEILRGIRDTADAEAQQQEEQLPKDLCASMSSAAQMHDVPPNPVHVAKQEAGLSQKNRCRKMTFKMAEGNHVELDLNRHVKSDDKDEYTNDTLPTAHTPCNEGEAGVCVQGSGGGSAVAGVFG